jgi:Arc/MetJ-type ribon-helix-helix transcriptional regulator
MKSNAKSSITLPASELRLVRSLKARLHAKSNVDVIRRGIRLLQETTDREALRAAFHAAAKAVRPSTLEAIEELDSLAGEGLD